MKKMQGVINCKYAVIRRDDMSVVAEMDYFPDSERAVMYRYGQKIKFLPMANRDIMGNENLFEELCVRAGCQT